MLQWQMGKSICVQIFPLFQHECIPYSRPRAGDTMMAAMFLGDREVLWVLSIYLKIGPVTEVAKNLQMDTFHKPHSEDHSEGKAECREMKHDAIASTSDC